MFWLIRQFHIHLISAIACALAGAWASQESKEKIYLPLWLLAAPYKTPQFCDSSSAELFANCVVFLIIILWSMSAFLYSNMFNEEVTSAPYMQNVLILTLALSDYNAALNNSKISITPEEEELVSILSSLSPSCITVLDSRAFPSYISSIDLKVEPHIMAADQCLWIWVNYIKSNGLRVNFSSDAENLPNLLLFSL